MTSKTIKLLSALALTAALAPAYAATYNVDAAITGYQYQDVPGNPFPVTITSIYTPTQPTAGGLWSLDTANPSVQGDLDYAPFNTHTSILVPVFDVSGWVNFYYPHSQSEVVGSAGSYDAATRTLSLTGVLFNDIGEWGVCTASPGFSCPEPGSTETRGSGSIDITLIFSADLRSFTGTGIHTFAHGDGSADLTSWSFNGAEVPVPAAAWLFGSGLLGLAGLARRRA